MSGLSLGTRLSNFKSVTLTVLELLAFNAQKFRGSRDRGHAPFRIKFLGIMSGLSLRVGTRVSNLKSIALTVLELFAFNSHDRPLRTHKHTDKQTHNITFSFISGCQTQPSMRTMM